MILIIVFLIAVSAMYIWILKLETKKWELISYSFLLAGYISLIVFVVLLKLELITLNF